MAGRYKLMDEGPTKTTMPHHSDFLSQHQEGNYKRTRNIFQDRTSLKPATKPKVDNKMTKEYKDATPKEKYDSAVKSDADKSQPGTMEMLGNLGRSIKDSVMGTNKPAPTPEKKKAGGMCGGGKTMKMAKGGSASSRADGCAQRGKTRGKMV